MKRIILFIAFLFAFMLSANAQVILLDSDENKGRATVEGEVPFIPVLGVTYDQYAPLESGALLLSGLGLVYLMKKKQKGKK